MCARAPRTCEITNEAFEKKDPFVIENPVRSRLWLLPAAKRLQRMRGVQQTVTEFCMYAKSFRKSTLFVSWGLNMSHIASHRCLHGRRGCCARTGKRHTQLAGMNSAGQWMTKIAEPYPHKLCVLLARAFRDYKTMNKTEDIESYLRRCQLAIQPSD